jgi:hypothetical protein
MIYINKNVLISMNPLEDNLNNFDVQLTNLSTSKHMHMFADYNLCFMLHSKTFYPSKSLERGIRRRIYKQPQVEQLSQAIRNIMIRYNEV